MTPSPCAGLPGHVNHVRRRQPVSDSPQLARQLRARGCTSAPALLGRYRDARGLRELVGIDAAHGRIVLDRDAVTLGDRRLVAHLDPEEPDGNAALVCRQYLADASGRWCRRLRPADLLAHPPGHEGALTRRTDRGPNPAGLSSVRFSEGLGADCTVESGESRYRLRAVVCERSSRQLRWCRQRLEDPAGRWEPVSLRSILGSLERYEPMRSATAYALAFHRDDPGLLLRRLDSEYERLCVSPIVLNRRLREAVVGAVERDGLSLSELAMRCGIVKRDRRGRLSGETSWLARRIGLMAESGRQAPTPWVHSDVLAVIARLGLRLSPHEVEVP